MSGQSVRIQPLIDGRRELHTLTHRQHARSSHSRSHLLLRSPSHAQ